MEINLLQANNGDAIHLRTQDEAGCIRNILIDGGTKSTYIFKDKKGQMQAGALKRLIADIREREECIDLLILTHVDDDHIGGILTWFEQETKEAQEETSQEAPEEAPQVVKKVWFNSGKLISAYFQREVQEEREANRLIVQNDTGFDTSIKQGVTFEDYIEKNQIWDKRLIKNGDVIEMFGLQFTILSPSCEKLEKLLNNWEKEAPVTETAMVSDYSTDLKDLIRNDSFKEDTSVPNGSSIAFIVDDGDTKGMLLGDAHPQPVINSLLDMGYSKQNPVKVDYVKLSHHGSKANTNCDLLNMIQSGNFLISSDSSGHGLPDKQCLARIIKCNANANLYFNYPELIPRIFSAQDHLDFPHFKVYDAQDM